MLICGLVVMNRAAASSGWLACDDDDDGATIAGLLAADKFDDGPFNETRFDCCGYGGGSRAVITGTSSCLSTTFDVKVDEAIL